MATATFEHNEASFAREKVLFVLNFRFKS